MLLLDGLGVYVENEYVGVSALAGPLRAQGFDTRVDTHFMRKTQGLTPDIIIGHSMGGSMAITYAREMVRAGKPAPLVITIDAAPAPPPCGVPTCINIRGPGVPNVRGATNIDAWASGATYVNHAMLPTHPVVKSIILDRTSAFLAARKTASRQGGSASSPALSPEARANGG